MWKELIRDCDEKTNVKYEAPASQEELEALEQDLEFILPEELKGYLLEANGDDSLMMSVEKIFDVNDQLRSECKQTCMPLDCILFFADNGCGGYYGYPIIDGKPRADRIIFWWRETDDRTLVATDLKEFLYKYYTGEI